MHTGLFPLLPFHRFPGDLAMKRFTYALLAGMLLLSPAFTVNSYAGKKKKNPDPAPAPTPTPTPTPPPAPAPVPSSNISPIQSTARPYGLQPVAPVRLSGSDARAQDFNTNYLPYFRELIDDKLSESVDFTDREVFRLDPSRLFLRSASDQPIRFYFVHEGAGYHNSIGYSATLAGAAQMAPPSLIFPDASFQGTTSTSRSAWEPLVVGDFVEIGNGAAGLQLDFFCIANGAQPSPSQYVATWYNNKELNPDGQKQHVVAFLMPDTRFVMIGFEDLWGGGDLDYNDALFVVDIGETNAENLFDIESTLPE
jgi:Domain of unknown function (DUF4114)